MPAFKKLAISSAALAAIWAGGWSSACDNCEKISAAAPAVILPNVTAVQHPITTANPLAQQFFDQGLTLVYGFNHDEAIRSFKKAAELDPDCAMAWWGVALALGPNYNIDVTPETELAAFQAIQKALKLKEKVSQPERDYIDALAVRYSDAAEPDLKQLARDYATAMRKLHAAYPDDTDAATLYADALMNLRPWKLWNRDGTPAEDTPEIISVLESVLSRDPNHVGANHLYIHAVEASPNPDKALPSADRLGRLSPGSGHLVHMPSHIYFLVGDYNRSALVNEEAIRIDDAYFRTRSRDGAYGMMYYNHNTHFAAVSHAWQGKQGSARFYATKLHDDVLPQIKMMPPLEQFATIRGLVDLHFADWRAILETPRPAAELKIAIALWHFNRAMALSATGKPEQAHEEQARFAAARKDVPADSPYGMVNVAGDALQIADHVLTARLAEAAGDAASAESHLRQAVQIQDRLNYEEPEPWPISVRQNLGGVLLRAGRAVEAEKAFRDDLKKYPRHGRSLFGLWQALEKQGRSHEAGLVRRQFEEAWKYADTTLSVEQL